MKWIGSRRSSQASDCKERHYWTPCCRLAQQGRPSADAQGHLVAFATDLALCNHGAVAATHRGAKRRVQGALQCRAEGDARGGLTPMSVSRRCPTTASTSTRCCRTRTRTCSCPSTRTTRSSARAGAKARAAACGVPHRRDEVQGDELKSLGARALPDAAEQGRAHHECASG